MASSQQIFHSDHIDWHSQTSEIVGFPMEIHNNLEELLFSFNFNGVKTKLSVQLQYFDLSIGYSENYINLLKYQGTIKI